MQSKLKRPLCMILCITILFGILCLPISAAIDALSEPTLLSSTSSTNDGRESVTTTEKFTEDGIDYVIERTTQYIGTRTYGVEIKIRSAVESADSPEKISAAQNGYFTVTKAGYYLLELWGGDGGDGTDNTESFLTDSKYFPGGTGGDGGYIYAKVWLEPEQTLVYSIGTDGGQAAAGDDEAGGENGEGGTHGAVGSRLVGGGGGFSALYFFDEGEFDEAWVTSTSIEIPENARLSKYILIAGGGGGGGAAAGATPYSVDLYAPDGGMGGSVANGVSVTLSGGGHGVDGYVFSGRNGMSSYTSTQYVGRGGTSVPAAIVNTDLNLIVDSTTPNDWTGTYNTAIPYGTGGSGNLRGGGGGAGYCGGSGGNMQGLLVPVNVGGGGGGSSFIAHHISYTDSNGAVITKQLDFTFDADDEANEYINISNVSKVGGACEITYLGVDSDPLDTDAFKDVTLKAEISKYFTVQQTASSCSGALSYSENATTGGTTVTATGLDITPSSTNIDQKIATVRLVISSNGEFVGGNSVELIHSITASLSDPHGSAKTVTLRAEENDALDFVNVPVRFTLETKSYTTSVTPKSFNAEDFYTDSYASVRPSLSSLWQYDYIESIGEYTVWNGETEITGSTVSVSETTTFTVKYTVALKNIETSAPVTVGPINDNPYVNSKNAIVSIVSTKTAELNDVIVTASKGLEYQNGNYVFKLNLEQTTQNIVFPYSTQAKTTAGAGSYEVLTSGWYYIQAWGANGQASQGAATQRYTGATRISVDGASGGAGGYVSGYIYLEAGSSIDYVIGEGKTDPSGYYVSPSTGKHPTATGSVGYSASSGGAGGNYTSVSIEGNVIAIAGGGGGGGGSAAASTTGLSSPKTGQGEAGKQNSTINNELILNSSNAIDYASYNGKQGTSGSAYAKYPVLSNSYYANGGGGGDGGSNYLYADMSAGYDYVGNGASISKEALTFAASKTTTKSSGTAGQVSITLLESDTATAEREKLSGVDVSIAISQYFDVVGVSLNASNANLSYTEQSVDLGNGAVATVVSATASYTASMVRGTEDGVEVIRYTASPTFNITVKPKAEFLGGNDVPVLISGYLGGSNVDSQMLVESGVRVTKATEFMHPPRVEATDYANVALNFDFESGGVEDPIFTVQDKTVTLGESLNESDLYTFDQPEYSGDDAWRAEFVKFVQPTTDGDALITPTQTTQYPLAVKLTPKAEAQYATIIDNVEDVEYELFATVYVNVCVTFNIENMTSDGEALAPHGYSYTCIIEADNGYVLPASIKVYHKISETERAELSSGFTYDSATGVIILAADIVTNHIEIEAAADKQTFSIKIAYATDANGDDVRVITHATNYEAGAAIDLDAIIAEEGIVAADIPGYTYAWTYDTHDGSKPTVMPANELWIYGGYQKNTYKFNIHYVYEGGAEAAESVEVTVQYGDSYSVASPAIKGYKADMPIVTGTQGTEVNDVVVTYIPSSNEVIILLLKKDGTEAFTAISDSLTTGETKTYNIAADYSLPGYTPDQESVTVTMDGDSQTLIVYYIPNKYTVSFEYAYGAGEYGEFSEHDFSSATLDYSDTKLVEYENVYSYDAESLSYVGLPTPHIAGFTFDGWYLDKSFSTAVKDSDTVTRAENHTLYAKWEATPFKLTIVYDFIYTENDFLPEGYGSADEIRDELNATEKVFEVGYGSPYSVDVNQYVGYSSYTLHGLVGEEKITALTGTMPATNVVVVITYEINSYTVTFKDNPGYYIDYSDWDGTGEKPASVAADAYDTEWATVVVKHDVSPEYPLGETAVGGAEVGVPYQDTIATYTYSFKGWMSSDGSTYYDGVTPATFPTAWGNVVYYTRFGATENIISLTQNSVTTYYTTVAEAIAAMEAAFPSVTTATLAFRRNSHNGTEIVLDGDTLDFGNIYVGTTLCTVTVNLGGCSVKTTNGESVVSNTGSDAAIALIFDDTAAVKGGLYVYGEGNVVAIDSDSRGISFRADITVSAESENGDATAIKFASNTSSVNMTFSAAPKISATANNGKAVGIHLSDDTYTCNVYSSSSYSTYAPAITVTGRDAYGVYADEYGYLGSSSYYFITNMTVIGTDSAYGIYNVPTARICWLSMIDVTAVGEGAIAVGVVGGSAISFISSSTSTAEIIVKAPDGTGYGLIVANGLNTTPLTCTVVAKNAIGIEVRDGSTLTLNSNYNVYRVTGTESAIGINVLIGCFLARNSSYYFDITATATAGDAIGIKNAGAVSALTATVTVTATGGNAYGIYNIGGSIAASGITSAMNVTASSTDADAYGLYSEGGEIGTESDPLNIGAFAGSTYGIYCTDGSIYVSGNDVYFKGADEESALYENTSGDAATPNGVLVIEGYSQAAAKDDEPFYTARGYWRLGRTWTITFVTNGGSEIASVTQIFDTPLAKVTTAKRGYDFVEWNTDEALAVSYTYPSYMPDSDLTLYAEWDIIEYSYVYDPEDSNLTVTFNANYPTTRTGELSTVTASVDPEGISFDNPGDLTEENLNYIFGDLSYTTGTSSAKTLYVFTGWYTAQTRSDDARVLLNGGLQKYDTDSDGSLELYGGWVTLTYSRNYKSFDTEAATGQVNGSYRNTASTSYGKYYMYFVVPEDGSYDVILNNDTGSETNSYYQKYYTVTNYGNASTVTVKSATVLGLNATTTVPVENAKAGDLIVVGWYRYSGTSYQSTVSARIQSEIDVDSYKDPQYYSKRYEYTVADGENGDGIVELMMPSKAGYQFLGWSDLVTTNDKGEMIIKLTPEMVETYDAWVNRDILDLYSQWEEITWEVESGAGRLHRFDSDWVTPDEIVIRDDETVTLAFTTEYEVTDKARFTFENGLCEGTILTLIDHSGEFPMYYTYTVTENGVKEVNASDFTRMGDSAASFHGITDNVVLQICYANAGVSAEGETVGIITDDLTPEITKTYTFIAKAVDEVVIEDEAIFDYLTEHAAEVSVSGIGDIGINDTDGVYILIYWNELYMAPGASFKLVSIAADSTETEIQGERIGNYVRINTGLTVAELNAAGTITYTLKYTLPTMQYNEFTAHKFTYEIYAAPAEYEGGKTLFAEDIKPLARFTETVTVTETPSITVGDTSTYYVAPSGVLNVDNVVLDDAEINLSMIIYQLTDSGFEITNACLTLFDEVPDGLIDEVTLSNGRLVFNVSANAADGRYYLKLIYGDKYLYVPIKVRAS